MVRSGAKYEYKNIICLGCGIMFDSKARNKNQRYCTKSCAQQHILVNDGRRKKGEPAWNKGLLGYMAGRITSEDTKTKIRETNRARNYLRKDWKGDRVGYSALHCWLDAYFVKNECEDCRRKNCRLEWANISGEYKRDINDFRVLCVRCHSAFDRDKRGVRKFLFESNGIGIRKTGNVAEKVR
jgi:hypothetical protein